MEDPNAGLRRRKDFPPPVIHLNSDTLQNRSDVVLTAGSAFILSCHGNTSLQWSSTAFFSASKVRPGVLEVESAKPRHTGTYRCTYTNSSLEHLHTSVHLYVKDTSDPTSVFVTPYSTPSVWQGDDFLFRCLLTDPSVTNLTLVSVGNQATGAGQGLPQGMNVSVDPHQGVVIHKVDRKFNGRYVCTGWKNKTRVTSNTLHLIVMPRQRRPPQVSVDQTDFFRVVGEPFAVTCMTSNPSLIYKVSWMHPDVEAPNVTQTIRHTSSRTYMNSTLIVGAVSEQHGGQYTCTARNEAGDAAATIRLRVLDAPFLTARLRRRTRTRNGTDVSTSGTEPFGRPLANASDKSVMDKWEVLANVSVDATKGDPVSDSGSTVDVLEGGDVTLTVAMEAYPPIKSLEWTVPSSENDSAARAQSYTANGYRSQASLLLRHVRDEEKGRYALRYANAVFRGSFNFDLRVLRAPTGVITVENDTLTCSGSGFPPPTLWWSQCSGLVNTCGDASADRLDGTAREGEGLKKHLALPRASADDITIECVSVNSVGRSQDVFFLREGFRIKQFPFDVFTGVGSNDVLVFSGSAGGSVLTAPLAAASAGVVFLLLLIVFLIFRIKRRPKYEIRWKIVESCHGNNYTFVDPSLLPYNNLKWEFPRDKLRLGGVLGSGAFGKVVEATAYGLGSQDETRVAVKMLKPSAHSEEREALMCELKILSHLGYHDNIVNLLGACTRGGPVLMITEYCFHGDLLNFLREHAHRWVAAMLEPEHDAKYSNVRIRSDSGISCCSEYQEMQPMLSHAGTQRSARLLVSDLMRFSYQVAQGLDFLSTRNCIHRDVAARNVLLTDRHVAKICDFGLARDIRNDDNYIVQGNARLPVKWMSPESIFQCLYTVQSDVWSYGVLLWEIFSLGKSPYPNVAVDTKFYKMIKDGHHMERPDFAPPQMYQLMTSCWRLEPTDRPTFRTIARLMERLLSSADKATPGEQPTYKNIDEREEDQASEEEEGMGEDSLKEEEQGGGEEDEDSIKMSKNIYQLS
ncbi:macrophage colony-stimulating factor 1 receptor 2 isoform X1 [Syngnathoides biaculeatus]|uniref:macrophage colony-stimulating factor 1 receptor 2 isoform X1 n=1 Tax=Syngnathoides biaculeatus TaxID=300417 RepID=UPI002ADE6616|nr:macrophage colony-stimulating factor 1 receptor 2 isoform X1 [Syngnathoides biaculeatus]